MKQMWMPVVTFLFHYFLITGHFFSQAEYNSRINLRQYNTGCKYGEPTPIASPFPKIII